MRMVPDKYEEMPEELCDALSEAGFDPFKEHSRWDYTQVFVRQNANDDSRSLTRREVQVDLEQQTTVETAKTTANNALGDLVDAGILTCDTDLDTHQYWLSYSPDPSSATTVDGAIHDGGPVAEPVAGDDSTDTTTSDADRLAGLTRRYFAFERVWLAALVVGLTMTLVTLVLLRLSVPTTLSIGSAALAWAVLSFGGVVLVVSLRYIVN